MFKRFWITVLSASALLQLTNAMPADPTITTAAVLPRQNPDNFLGYLEVNNTWTSEYCDPGLTWYQNGQYAQCCPATRASCYAATACVGGSQIYTYPDRTSVRTIACTENYNNTAWSICNTIYIFENTQDSNPRTNINCGKHSVNWSYYRDIPASATEKITTSSTTSIAQPSSTANTGPTQAAEPKSESKAWIAGAVVGPIVGLALVGLGVFFLLRRKKSKVVAPQHGTATMAPVDPSQPPAGVGGYTDAKPQFATAPATYYNQPGQPDPHVQQGYPQQGGYSPAPQTSPAPQYGSQSPYNAPASPPLPGNYTNDAKYGYVGGAAELGGGIAPVTPGSLPHPTPTPQAAELGVGVVNPHGAGLPGSSELPTNTHNKPQ